MAELITRCRPILGTFVEISSDCEAAIEAAYEAVERTHRLMSAHDPESDISRVNRFAHCQSVAVDAWTAAVIERAIFWSKQSQGAFDVVRAGRVALEAGRLPLHPGQEPDAGSDWTAVQLRGAKVRLKERGCLDLGGIAKGFAVDRAIAALRAAGAKCGLVNAGGDIAGFGPEAWPVQVVDPHARRAVANVAVANGAVATSSVLPDGDSVHLPAISGDLKSATVCAPNAMDADALTKVVMSGSAIISHCLAIAEARAFVLTGAGRIEVIEMARRAA